MVEALRFQQASPKLVAPPVSEGLPKGLVLQLWIRRTGDTTRQPIVELAGASSRIVMGTGARPDMLSLALIAGGKTTEISAPGTLPIARWVQVRAIVAPDGTAELDVLGMKLAQGKLPPPGSEARTLMIGGLIGELAQLQVWKHYSPTRLSYTPPLDLDAAKNLWAYYPLAALEWDATSKQSVAKDAGPNQRHAAPQGSTNVPIRVLHDEPLDRGQAAHLRFLSNDRTPNLGPLIGLSGRLTLEAWVCPVGNSAMPVVQLQGTDSRLVLAAGGPDGEVTLLSTDNAQQSMVLARATGLARPNQWSHVAVTLEVARAKFKESDNVTFPQLTIGLFQQGQLRKRESSWLVGVSTEAAARVAKLVKDALIPEVHLGGLAPGYPFFRGGMAEVRIWRSAAQERVEALWLTRARGDEPELIACYRLDTDPGKALVDISPRRGFAQVPSGTSLAQEQCPPLAATSGALAFRVRARGKLLREWLTKPIDSALINKLVAADTTTGQINNIVDGGCIFDATTGQTDNIADGRERRVFDATIEVTSRSGNAPLGRMLDVRLDQPLISLQIQDGKFVETPWAANKTHSIPLPASGRVRLRFAAEQLACPTIRLRVSATPGGVWTIVRPDESVQGRLRRVTAQSLKSPTDGRRSPLPAGTSDEDTQALADALARLGTQLVREPSASSNTSTRLASTKFLGPVDDWVEDGIELAEDAYEGTVSTGQAVLSTGQDMLAGATTVAKSAGQLIVRGTQELEQLAAKCAKVGAWLGEQAIANAISSADQLAFVSSSWGTFGRWVEVIGTSIVDGSEVAWRVIVSGVDDALAAVTQLIERIGAKIQAWIDYLAWLFMWDDFLAASDEFHAHIEEAMRGVGQQIAGLDGIKNQLTNALRETVEDAIGKRSLADVFGIDADAASPAFEQLDYVLEQAQSLFESSDLKWATSGLGQDTGLGPSDAVSTQAGELVKLRPLGDPSDVLVYLNTPLSELLASNEQLANGSSSMFDAVFDPIAESTTELLEQLNTAMFSRLSAPYVTDFIESVILCGRTLTVARILALMAAIPAVLTQKISKSSKSSKVLITSRSNVEVSQEEQDRREADRRTRWVLWGVMAGGLVNTIVVIAKSVAERRQPSTSNSKYIAFLQLISGGIGIIRGIFLVGRIPACTPSTRVYAGINANVEMTAGLCAAFFGMQGLKPLGPTEVRKNWSTVETVLQMILGATVITVSGVALDKGDLGDDRTKTAFGFRCGSWVLSLIVRVSEKLDDLDSSGRLKYVTMGFAGLSVVVEVSEAIYGNVGETEAQT